MLYANNLLRFLIFIIYKMNTIKHNYIQLTEC